MIRQGGWVRGLDGKNVPARVYGLIICRIKGNLVIGIGLGKKTYFWEIVK